MVGILTILVLTALGAVTRSAVAVNDAWLSKQTERKTTTLVHLEKHGLPDCHKWWSITISGTKVCLAWGRLGGYGIGPWQRQATLEYETPAQARSEVVRRLKAKLRNGYTIVKGGVA